MARRRARTPPPQNGEVTTPKARSQDWFTRPAIPAARAGLDAQYMMLGCRIGSSRMNGLVTSMRTLLRGEVEVFENWPPFWLLPRAQSGCTIAGMRATIRGLTVLPRTTQKERRPTLDPSAGPEPVQNEAKAAPYASIRIGGVRFEMDRVPHQPKPSITTICSSVFLAGAFVTHHLHHWRQRPPVPSVRVRYPIRARPVEQNRPRARAPPHATGGRRAWCSWVQASTIVL